MQNKQEIIKKIIFLIILTASAVIGIFYKKQKIDWLTGIDIFLWCVPLLVLIVMIIVFQMKKK
jgi:hypothetical protein